jgi:hypothetical protein
MQVQAEREGDTKSCICHWVPSCIGFSNRRALKAISTLALTFQSTVGNLIQMNPLGPNDHHKTNAYTLSMHPFKGGKIDTVGVNAHVVGCDKQGTETDNNGIRWA